MKFKEYVEKKRYAYAVKVTSEWFKEGFDLPNNVYIHKAWFSKKKELRIDILAGYNYAYEYGNYYYIKDHGFYEAKWFEDTYELSKETI